MSNESEPVADPDARSDAEKWAKERFEKFADTTGDVNTALAFVRDAASVASGLWVTYLGILAYLGITVGAVTHANLFPESPVKLPRTLSRNSVWSCPRTFSSSSLRATEASARGGSEPSLSLSPGPP